MKKVLLTPDEYVASLPDDVCADIQALDKNIAAIFRVGGVVWQGKFWGGTNQTIIGYGDWSYQRSDKEIIHWFKVGLAVQKNYISVYINAVEDGQYVAKKYVEKLGKVKIGASSISFQSLADVNVDELLKLVQIAGKENG